MDELDAEDARDQGRLDKPFALDIDPARLPDVETLKRRIAFHEQNLRIMEETGKTQLLFTDPEAAMMRTKDDSNHPCYNIQTATDAKHSFIVGFEASNRTDMGQLCRTAEITVLNEVEIYKGIQELIHQGDYYRLADPLQEPYTAWMFERLWDTVCTDLYPNPCGIKREFLPRFARQPMHGYIKPLGYVPLPIYPNDHT